MIDPKFFEKTLFLNGYIIFTLIPYQKANASVYQKANASVWQKANASVCQKANTLVCIGLPKGKHIGLCGLRVELILMKSRIYKSLELRMTGR